MQSRSSQTAAFLIIGAAALAAAPAFADITDDEKAAKRAKVCAQADERYAELFPGTKDDGTVIVKLYKYHFCPGDLTVKTGTTVRWVNVDKRTSHSVWLKESKINESERFFPEEQWEFSFQASGNYPYLCGPHWENEGMLGSVTVTE
ncbi:MAG: copper-binding protein [Rhodospirillales bacterium]|nr:copper-binding protein [Rhodospirillales bacterium]